MYSADGNKVFSRKEFDKSFLFGTHIAEAVNVRVSATLSKESNCSIPGRSRILSYVIEISSTGLGI